MPALQLVIDCHDAGVLLPFWAAALDYLPSPPPPGFDTWNAWYRSVGVPDTELDPTGDGTDRLTDPAGTGPAVWFQPVPENKVVKNRLHLDLYVGVDGAGRRLPYAERRPVVRARADALIELGGVEIRVDDAPEHERYSVGLADPEGNELCLV